MIAKSDLQAVLDQLRAETRAANVEPPTVEEMLAYRRGELSGDDEARVRELLICYPDLLRALMMPLPEDDGSLPDEKLDEQWAAMRAHMHGQGGGKLVHLWQALSAIAAALAIVMGALFWHERTERQTPRVLVLGKGVLTAGGSRGGGPERVRTVTPQDDVYVLEPYLYDQQALEVSRVEVRDAVTSKLVWSARGLQQSGETIVVIPLKVLNAGSQYKLAIYGEGAEPLGTFEFATAGVKR